jgi:adenine-specific DNA-methyltransferase
MSQGRKTDNYQYASASRSNLPTEQTEPLMTADDKAPRPFTPTDRRRDDEPVLAWSREDLAQTYDAHPLYVREKIHPGAFVQSLKSGTAQSTLFDDFNGLPSPDAAYEWYEHAGNWQNRLIHGESARVMASLAERERLSGRVQMIFFDPPYGIGFKSNFQVSTRNRETAEGRKGLPCDTRTIRAFRDTYDRGIHSYLDQMLEKLTLCRELLTESGSIFVQIGDENVHRMAVVLDEVFGHENRVATIPFVTSGSSSARTLSSVADFLLWYARDKTHVKYNHLYEPLSRAQKVEHMSSYAMVELRDGTTRSLTQDEEADPETHLPDGARLYRRMRLASPGTSTTGRSEPYHWRGHDWPCPPREQWRVSMDGMDRLAELGRLDAAGPQSLLSWKRYEYEIPGRRIHNVWSRQMSASDKRYVVQTADSVIERCMLMATDPGDLVFDPTCGGGTTAVAAETWGRRWITCDTSPVAVAIARQRLTTATFDYWTLADSAEGAATEAELSGLPAVPAPAEGWGHDPAHGLVYERVPTVSASSLAYDENPPPTLLVNQPTRTTGVVRVTSPFTVESESPWSHVPFDEVGDGSTQGSVAAMSVEHAEFVRTVTESLKRSSIHAAPATGRGGDLHISEIEPWPGTRDLVSHLVAYTVGERGVERRAGLVVAPEDATVTAAMIRKSALDTAQSIHAADLVIIVGFEFAPDTGDDKIGRVGVVRVRMHRDLQIRDLKDDDRHPAFVIVGQPEVRIHNEPNDEVSVELLGYDTFDPATGTVKAGGADDVACWMLDTAYDGTSFFARRIHFPGAQNDRQIKRLRAQLGRGLDKLRWDAALSVKSAPFERPPEGRIAIKIITTTGTEMSLVADMH